MISDIGVVIVTYNRIALLKKTLDLFDNQKLLPHYIIVVNNCSTDSTSCLLENWLKEKREYKKIVVNENENIGGSGGFHDGLKKGIEEDANWIWVSDDDAFPDENAISEAQKYILNANVTDVSAICASVIDIKDREKYITSHRRRITHGLFRINTKDVQIDEYSKKQFEINAASYVGLIVKKNALLNVGLTIRDYFIWFDDTEHCLRLSKQGRILCVPSIKVYHPSFSNGENNYDWREYYGLRNGLDTYKRHLPKRCFVAKCICRKLKCIYLRFKGNKEYYSLYKKALIDGINGNLGLDDLYKPGWVPKKHN